MKPLPIIHVRNLGRMSFNRALELQKAGARKVLDSVKTRNLESTPKHLFLVEHDPVYTVGIRHKQYVKDVEKLKNVGADFVVTDRGGLITFHGPGQLVAYPVIYLGDFDSKKSVRWYVKQLERTLIDTCRSFDVDATTTEDVGVWVEDRKIAAIGIHASRYVTTHGIALNCNVDLDWYSHIVPCGLEGKAVTSLSEELHRNVTVNEAIPEFLRSFEKNFPCQLETVCDSL